MRQSLKNFWFKSLGVLGLAACMVPSVQAGDVRVTREGALLKVVGDNTANQISMVQTAVGDVFVQGAAGTTVNGGPSVVLRRLSLNAMEIRMEGGNDVVSLRGFNIANDLYVNLGSGNDRFANTGPFTVLDQLTIDGEGGTDTVQLTNATIGLDLYITGGIGAVSANLAGLDIGKTLTVIGDDLNDNVIIDECLVGDYIAVETKSGNDRVTIGASVAFGLAVSTDAGADTISVTDFFSTESIGIFTGLANDTVNLLNVSTNTNLTVTVDAGDDRVVGEDVSAGSDAVFEGGNGRDTIIDRGITGGSKKEIKEFEVRQ